MTIDQALLQSIIETPDDDTPRLVYADWLDDQGDAARAEFIRAQCTLARIPADDPRQPALRNREQELLRQYGWVWAENLGWEVSAWAYRRGFIECAEMGLEGPAGEFLPVLEKAPIRHIRDVSQFCDLSGVVEALPHFDRLTGLEFWGLYAFEDELLAAILASPHLANLRTLILHHDRNGNIADENILAEAMHSPHRSNLQELAVNVDGSWRGPSCKILQAIAASPYLRDLRKLNLSNAGDEGNQPQIDADTIRALGQSPNLAGLTQLDLGQTSFPIEAWDEVLRWPCLTRLTWLRLHYARQVNPPSMMTVAEIADLPAYRQAFEQRVAAIDWDSQFITPEDGNSSWTGLSWDGLRQRHLFAMWPYVQRRDYDGLEAAYRDDCRKYAGESAVQAIDELPFSRYQKSLADGLQRAIIASGRHAEATSIYLRIRPDLQWGGNYHVCSGEVPEPFEPCEEFSYTGLLMEFESPEFPEAAAVRQQFSSGRKPLDPGGVGHYLVARTVAAFGRCLARHPSPVPVIFSCMYAVFRM